MVLKLGKLIMHIIWLSAPSFRGPNACHVMIDVVNPLKVNSRPATILLNQRPPRRPARPLNQLSRRRTYALSRRQHDRLRGRDRGRNRQEGDLGEG